MTACSSLATRVCDSRQVPVGNVLYDLFSTNPNETKELEIGSKKKGGKVI